MKMTSGHRRSFLYPFVATITLAVVHWFIDPYVYVGDRPKFEVPIIFDVMLGAVFGSILGSISLLGFHLLFHRRRARIHGFAL